MADNSNINANVLDTSEPPTREDGTPPLADAVHQCLDALVVHVTVATAAQGGLLLVDEAVKAQLVQGQHACVYTCVYVSRPVCVHVCVCVCLCACVCTCVGVY